ncbi:uncharacterized protein EI90DRAFT_3126857 [Cantharellus anzutake]|uniref:uncharacterized protein n=1 Tax=Cantharellus anzutake TaxID=1750568 RepID=UPI001905A0B7|nr:uncharacterized protein EI90DRAFT_3126857 [Cantharellus anzutake]KAF8327554.1 hypothetical protein EI90DRAFT_3126857 [Cantharellus anzutake]
MARQQRSGTQPSSNSNPGVGTELRRSSRKELPTMKMLLAKAASKKKRAKIPRKANDTQADGDLEKRTASDDGLIESGPARKKQKRSGALLRNKQGLSNFARYDATLQNFHAHNILDFANETHVTRALDKCRKDKGEAPDDSDGNRYNKSLAAGKDSEVEVDTDNLSDASEIPWRQCQAQRKSVSRIIAMPGSTVDSPRQEDFGKQDLHDEDNSSVAESAAEHAGDNQALVAMTCDIMSAPKSVNLDITEIGLPDEHIHRGHLMNTPMVRHKTRNRWHGQAVRDIDLTPNVPRLDAILADERGLSTSTSNDGMHHSVHIHAASCPQSPEAQTHPLSPSPSRATSEAPTVGSQVTGACTAQPPLSASSSSTHSVHSAPAQKPAKKALRAQLKVTMTTPMMDTLDLAHQHFYYLLLKDPFASREQHLVLAREAFSRAFGQKPESQFEISQQMLTALVGSISRFRGRFKEQAEKVLTNLYSVPPGDNSSADVQERVKYLLKEGNFRFKNPAVVPRQGTFAHPGIVSVMSTFFTGCNLRGKAPPSLEFIEKFDTIQPSFIAFAITAIICALDDRKDGSAKKKTQFKAEVYGPKYAKQLSIVTAWKHEHPLLWTKLEKDIKDELRNKLMLQEKITHIGYSRRRLHASTTPELMSLSWTGQSPPGSPSALHTPESSGG